MIAHFMCRLTAVACLLFICGCKEKKPTPQADNSSGNPLSAPADYLGAVNKAQKSAQRSIGNVNFDQTIKSFFAEEGRFPNSLDELKSKGVAIPDAPPGMKWSYDPATGQVKAVPQ